MPGDRAAHADPQGPERAGGTQSRDILTVEPIPPVPGEPVRLRVQARTRWARSAPDRDHPPASVAPRSGVYRGLRRLRCRTCPGAGCRRCHRRQRPANDIARGQPVLPGQVADPAPATPPTAAPRPRSAPTSRSAAPAPCPARSGSRPGRLPRTRSGRASAKAKARWRTATRTPSMRYRRARPSRRRSGSVPSGPTQH